MRIFQLLLATLLITSSLSAQDENLHIYLCFGQSNMEGQGAIESQDANDNERFKVFQAIDCPNLGRVKETWYTATPPNCQCYSKLSPSDNFGRTMVDNLNDSISVAIINVSVAGCDIRLFDKDIYEDYDSTHVASWFLDKIIAYDGNPYQYLIDLAQLAQQDGVIKGILLHQGETNTGQTAWTSYVEKIYSDMLTDLSLEPMNVPLLVGELVSAPGNCCSSMNPIINQLPDLIPNAHVISSDGCGAADGAHFDSEGYRMLGERYADKMLTLLDNNVATDVFEITTNGFSFQDIFPNPVTAETVHIRFSIPARAAVSITMFSSSGVEISKIAGREFTAGEHTIEQVISGTPSGVYHYEIRTSGFVASKRLVIQ